MKRAFHRDFFIKRNDRLEKLISKCSYYKERIPSNLSVLAGIHIKKVWQTSEKNLKFP